MWQNDEISTLKMITLLNISKGNSFRNPEKQSIYPDSIIDQTTNVATDLNFSNEQETFGERQKGSCFIE